MALAAAVCLSSLLGCLAISFATARSTANVVPRSTGSITRMPPVRGVNCHVCVSRKRFMAGPRWTLLTGSHDGFHTTSTSFSPVSDERSAKMSCTSHKGSPLFAGSVAAADWLRSPGIMSLSFVAAECVILSIAGSTCDGCGWTDSVREVAAWLSVYYAVVTVAALRIYPDILCATSTTVIGCCFGSVLVVVRIANAVLSSSCSCPTASSVILFIRVRQSPWWAAHITPLIV